jgi:hypothetical protein
MAYSLHKGRSVELACADPLATETRHPLRLSGARVFLLDAVAVIVVNGVLLRHVHISLVDVDNLSAFHLLVNNYFAKDFLAPIPRLCYVFPTT